MSRGIHANVITELAKDSFNTAHLLHINFATPIYLTESLYSITYGGNTYSSSSHFMSISDISEASDIQLGSVSIGLSGVSQEYIAILLGQTYIDRRVVISRVVLSNANTIIGNPIVIYDGRIQSFSIKDSTNSSNINLIASSHWADFEKKSNRRTNSNSQKIHFSADKGFEFAPNTMRDLKWGRA